MEVYFFYSALLYVMKCKQEKSVKTVAFDVPLLGTGLGPRLCQRSGFEMKSPFSATGSLLSVTE